MIMQRLRIPAVRVAVVAGALAMAASVAVAAPIVYPAKGQTAQQQAADEAACHDWAVLQVGFDPTKVAPPKPPTVQAAPVQQTPPKSQTTTRGVLRGAAVGAGIGAIAGGDAGDAAIAGAVIGGVRGHRKGEQQKAAAQQQAAAQTDAAVQAAQQSYEAEKAEYNARVKDYDRARAACLTGKGYTVK